jgi:hypothetical protein
VKIPRFFYIYLFYVFLEAWSLISPRDRKASSKSKVFIIKKKKIKKIMPSQLVQCFSIAVAGLLCFLSLWARKEFLLALGAHVESSFFVAALGGPVCLSGFVA